MANLPLPQINFGTSKTLAQFTGLTRDYMRDHAELNRLSRGEETSDRMIVFALMFTVDRYNIIPPHFQTVGIEDFPSSYMLLTGAVSHILKSAGILMSRNQLDYSAAGVSVAVSNKTPLYQSWAQLFDQEWHQMVKQFKVARNIEFGYGHAVSSEYLFLNGFFGDF